MFQRQQKELGDTITLKHKADLRVTLRNLCYELDRYLAREYGVDPEKKRAFEAWRASHQPFHWFAEFYGIMSRGGFDVIIGNPPYVEYSKVKDDYTVLRYATESCRNLYAFVVERSLFLARKTGRLGLIVPHSIAATYRSNPVQTILYRELRAFYSCYSRRPGKLFDGADQCLCIVIGFRVGQDTPVLNASTTYRRWYTEERSSLFKTLAYEHIVGQYLLDQFCVFPKIGDHIEITILERVRKQKALATVMRDTGAEFFCHRISRYFIKATDFVPYFCSERDGIKRSDDFKVYYTLNTLDARTIVAALNSSLFYWFWRVMLDGYHCGKENISAFCFEQNR